jgi:acetyl-CoA C-acetyltransferase
MHRYGLSREQFAEVVVKSRRSAVHNPVALETDPVTVEDVLNAPLLADPIGELDVYSVTDASIALVLAVEEKAGKLTNKPVWITGLGTSRDVHNPGSRDLADCDALKSAAKRAYNMAGITDPEKDLDLVELSGPFSYQELLWSEGLGLCDKGEGAKLLESGKTHIGGSIPVNPSGGVLPGVPTMLHGLSRVIEAAVQLRGEAGDYQVEGAKTAVAHGTSGPCGQLQAVMTLGI